MCAIFGYCAPGISPDALRSYFYRTESRGPDAARMVEVPGGVLGFHRLAIMGLCETGMQPFFLDGDCVVCNGELYGFREEKKRLEKKGYSFRGDSDCELLLPLYREWGCEMFSHLDAEFALVLYDAEKKEFIAARDPIGIRPLYFGKTATGVTVFASEPKNLIGLCETVRPFPPGHYWRRGEFIPYRDMTKVSHIITDPIDTVCRNIREKLIAGVEKRLDADAPIGFLLSGGLDSSLVCAIAARALAPKKLRTFAIGMASDAIDLKYARRVADYLGTEHTEVLMTPEEVVGVLPELSAALGTFDITTVRASVGMYLVCKYIHEHTDIRVLLTGEISDELFGYKYTDFAPSPEAFQAESEKRVRELHAYDVLRADRCISVHSLEARVPFGDLDFVSYVMGLDPSMKMNVYGKGKYLLRRAFEGDWLPEDILWREKAAFSDAVGHSMVDDLKEYAEGRYSDEQFRCLKANYTYATPFTKESLLYRELFEKNYPGQGEMIPGFWMPNPEWSGCRVSDPSARVLSNYGDSGK